MWAAVAVRDGPIQARTETVHHVRGTLALGTLARRGALSPMSDRSHRDVSGGTDSAAYSPPAVPTGPCFQRPNPETRRAFKPSCGSLRPQQH